MNKITGKMQTQLFKDLFDHTLGDEYIARTYLMAKNIAENHRLTNQNAQYDIGSNILQRTPGGADNTIILTDLQKIKLNRSENGTFPDDADRDGIQDGNEMGRYEPVDITDFVEHMLKAESGLSDVSELMTNYKNRIRAANNDKTKKNLVESQKDIDVLRENNKDRIKVYLMSYTSNPILKDTDFDGIDDGYGEDDEAHKNQQKDLEPLNNKIKGNMASSSHHIHKNINFESHMDYRYFFMDEYNYYDELSTMSLLLANAMNKMGSELSDIDYMMPHIGYDNYVRRNVYGDVGGVNLVGIDIGGVNYSVEYVTGLRVVEYSKDNSANNYISKLIVPIVIKTPDNVSLSKSYSEIGEPNWTEKCDTGKECHNVKSYEVYAELIKDDLYRYCLETTGIDISAKNIVFWITGHKEAGAVANVLASKYIDEGHKVYAYTFGSPMTLYNNPDEKGYTRTGYSMRYDSIFNVVNESDAWTYMMPQSAGFSRYGKTCFAEGKHLLDNIASNSTREINEQMQKIFKNNKNDARTYLYSDKQYLSNYFQKLYKGILNHSLNISSNDFNTLATEYKKNADLFRLTNLISENSDRQHFSSTTDVYYYIAKDMQNADITNVVNLHDNKLKRLGDESTGEVLEALELLGNYYVNNIRTYSYKAGVKKYIATLSNVATERDVVKHGGNSLYQYELFEGHDKTPVIITENLNWDDGNGYGDVDYNIHADYIGNDCSDFAQAVILMVSNGYRGDKNLSQYPKFKDTGKEKLEKHDYKKIDKYKQYDSLDGSHAQTKGIRLHDTNAEVMRGIDPKWSFPINFENAMLELGYKKYMLNNKTLKWYSRVKDPATGDMIEEYESEDFETININFLEPGDLLCRGNHVEFYYGYGQGVYNFEDNTYMRGNKINIKDNKASSTFGWGRIQKKFPLEKNEITFDSISHMFGAYDVIYRKVN